MNSERYWRLIVGIFVLSSVLLGVYYSPYWFFFTGFVGLNLIQYAFTDWCPLMNLLRRLETRAREQKAHGEFSRN